MNDQVENHGTPPGAANVGKMPIAEMAHEAGFIDARVVKGELFADSSTGYYAENVAPQLIRFAALVRAQALEEAAVICEAHTNYEHEAERIARSIRAAIRQSSEER